MNQSYLNEEMFDDLHEGVEALRAAAKTNSIPLSEKAAESLERLEKTVPMIRSRFRLWKEHFTDQATKAAKQTNEAVHKYPWAFTLGALGAGLLVGLSLFGSEEKSNSD